MTGPVRPTFEGPLRTDRLTVHHLAISRPGAPKVLLLGGSNFDLRLKRMFLETALARSCDLVTYEPRGIGRTDQPEGSWTMNDYQQDALAVLNALGWDEAHIVGESFGGMTALHLAMRAPERVSSMIVASATAGGPEHASYDIAEFLELSVEQASVAALCLQDTRNTSLRKDDMESFATLMRSRMVFEAAFRESSVANGGYARLLNARRGHDCTAELTSIATATTVIAGRFDAQAKPKAQQALATALPNATFHMFDAGHGVLFSNSDAGEVAMDAISNTARHKETAS